METRKGRERIHFILAWQKYDPRDFSPLHFSSPLLSPLIQMDKKIIFFYFHHIFLLYRVFSPTKHNIGFLEKCLREYRIGKPLMFGIYMILCLCFVQEIFGLHQSHKNKVSYILCAATSQYHSSHILDLDNWLCEITF